MSGIKKIQKEDILKSALDIARESGIENVQARNIAKRLNCSTQPIFYQFANMEELKRELLKKILEVYRNYLKVSENSKTPYKDEGQGYIRFAKEEPKLFSIIFMSENNLTPENFVSYDNENGRETLKNVCKVTGIISKEEAKKFHLKMWMFTHGIATLIATKTCEFSDKEISKMLTEEFLALMMLEKKKGEENE